jgi:hypothetical protein
MANLNFKTDLILGNDGEQTIKDFLISKGCSYISSNDDNKYDLTMIKKGVKTTYEIKTDVKCAPIFDTGNIFIEFSSRGKDSGIKVSKSDWFVTYFLFLNEIWFIKTNKLKQLIENNDFPIFKDAGDFNSQTHGYLIERKLFKEHFNVYKTNT